VTSPPPPPPGPASAVALALTASPTPASPTNLKIFGAEAVGMAVLMMVGPGSAILAADVIGTTGVALAFGLALVAMAYTIGHASGCHINPAVTLAFWIGRKISFARAGWYWLAQLVGAFVGALIIFIISDAGELDQTGTFAANGWGADIGSDFGFLAMAVVEVVFTGLFVLVVLSTTRVGYPVGFGGLAAGLAFGMIHFVTIPVDNTSVNPARSFGTALFSGWEAVSQLWAFVLFPLIGAVVGVLAWLVVHDEPIEGTLLVGGR
jgi:aquaporin Z